MSTNHWVLTRRELLTFMGAASSLKLGYAWSSEAACPIPTPVKSRAPLAPQAYYFLPLGSIKPAGWLRRQLQIQAQGLSGHLDETWPDVGPNSAWLGGSGEAWERGPYFVDGLVPLAWLLDSAPLKSKAQRFIDWTLSTAQPNGMIGPKSDVDWWPRMVMLKALSQYYELTHDPRVLTVMSNYFRYQLKALPTRPLENTGRVRWQDELVSVLWLYNRTGDAQLLDLARLLQAQGWNWRELFDNFTCTEKVTESDLRYGPDHPDRTHGVSNAMAIKMSPVWSLVSGEEADRIAVHRQLELLDRYHGLPIGLFSADEHFAGRNPSQGVELCAVVEAMYSLEHALAITGHAALADRLERIAYNALPAAFTDDMWAHQYDQQPNQIECSVKKGPWVNNGPESNLFGLDPQTGCCTANFHQGWPKLTASLWMAPAGGGLAAMVYAPCEVMTRVGDVGVRLRETTDYPFRDEVRITIEPERALAFPMKLRVPGWARGVKVGVNGHTLTSRVQEGFIIIERTWRKGDRIDLAFDFATQTVAGFNRAVSVEHGPLLFSLPIAARWKKLRDRELTADWEVYPASAWNYGLEEGARFKRSEQPLSAFPFSSAAPPVSMSVDAWRVPQWQSESNYALPPPPSPVALPGGVATPMHLIPYGAAKLRITSFPVVTRKSSASEET